MSRFGKTIKRQREHCGHSLQTLADEAKITKSHLWELEQGRSVNPTVKTILYLAMALNLEPGGLAKVAMADLPGVK